MRALVDRHLQRFGVSGSGRDWVTRALHPAGEHKSPGLPDQSSAAVLRPDYRLQATIEPPAGSTTWDCYIWTPPGDVNAVYWATGPAPCDFSAATAPPGATVGVLRLQDSFIPPFSCTAVENLSAGPIPAEIRTITVGTSIPKVDAYAFRHQFKSLTVHQIASAVADQGQVYAAQFAPLIRYQGRAVTQGTYASFTPPLLSGWHTTTLPSNEAQMTAMAPQMYMDASREGVYLPLRLSGPSQPFARTQNFGDVLTYDDISYHISQPIAMYDQIGATMTPTSADLNGSIPWIFQNVSFNGSTPPFLETPTPILMFDTGFDNTNIGVAIFRGLSGSAGGLGASLQVKVVAGLEIMPNPTASNRIFAEVAAPYEPRALEAYYSLCLELKDAYPASYNSLGDILDTIGSVASKIWGVFEPAVQAVAPTLVHAAMGGMGIPMLTGARKGSVRQTERPQLRAPPQPSRSSSVNSRTSIKSTGARRVTIGKAARKRK